MKKLFLGVLMAVTAITSPLLMANTNDKNFRFDERPGQKPAIVECCSCENHVSRWQIQRARNWHHEIR